MCLPRAIFLATMICMLLGSGLAQHTAAPAHRTEIVGYFTEFGVKPGVYTVKDLISSGAAARLTQLDYAFGLVADNQCRLSDSETAIQHPYSAADSVNGTAD